MSKQHRKFLVFALCFAMILTLMVIPLMVVPVLADEEQLELPDNKESVEPVEEPVEVSDDTPLDGNWCANEEAHWRADAVNQGIPTPHVDDNEDDICDICQWILSVDEPIEESVDEPIDGGYEYDDEFHWPAGGKEYKLPHKISENGACEICDFVKTGDDEPDYEMVPETDDKFELVLLTVMLLLSASAMTKAVLTLCKFSKQ